MGSLPADTWYPTVLPREDYHGFTECHHSQSYWAGLDPKGDYLAWIREDHPEWYECAAMPEPVDRDDARCSSWWDLPEHLSMNAWVTNTCLKSVHRHMEQRPEEEPHIVGGACFHALTAHKAVRVVVQLGRIQKTWATPRVEASTEFLRSAVFAGACIACARLD